MDADDRSSGPRHVPGPSAFPSPARRISGIWVARGRPTLAAPTRRGRPRELLRAA